MCVLSVAVFSYGFFVITRTGESEFLQHIQGGSRPEKNPPPHYKSPEKNPWGELKKKNTRCGKSGRYTKNNGLEWEFLSHFLKFGFSRFF